MHKINQYLSCMSLKIPILILTHLMYDAVQYRAVHSALLEEAYETSVSSLHRGRSIRYNS